MKNRRQYIKIQTKILEGRGLLQILQHRGGDRIRCMRLLRHLVLKFYHPKGVVGDMLKRFMKGFLQSKGCGLAQTIQVCHAKKYIYRNVQVSRRGLGGAIKK